MIEIERYDCSTGQVRTESDTLEKLDLSRVNSATGPIAVRGAALPVTLFEIHPGLQCEAMCIPGWRQFTHQVESPTTRIFKVANGIITTNGKVSFPTHPMFGVIGVSPESGDVSTFLADRHAGNMDDRTNDIGATGHLLVF